VTTTVELSDRKATTAGVTARTRPLTAVMLTR
jgi:hypothetical protein